MQHASDVCVVVDCEQFRLLLSWWCRFSSKSSIMTMRLSREETKVSDGLFSSYDRSHPGLRSSVCVVQDLLMLFVVVGTMLAGSGLETRVEVACIVVSGGGEMNMGVKL